MTAEKKKCITCNRELTINTKSNPPFYKSYSEWHKDGYLPICKKCLNDKTQDDLQSFRNTLRAIDKPFIYESWESAKNKKTNTLGTYLKDINLNFSTLTYDDSEFSKTKETKEIKEDEKETVSSNDEKQASSDDEKNREDVVRMLNYDPFEGEVEQDKRHLFNKLVDFLDESTLEDGLKLQSVIEIVKGFNQIDKINLALVEITRDAKTLAQGAGSIKVLIDSKQKILNSILKLAEDNGISVKHNTQKSKGAGTLTGIIKLLNEKGFEEASVNLFDIETAQGMRQVADLSNKSIAEQLQFDENDYTEMIIEQKDIIDDLSNKNSVLEEQVRTLKKQLMANRNGDDNE